ncbi:hypothetical protein PHYBLDRAFT_144046 [Phycomyces blakesleeanus NRRL 1555(-)]|uniref:Uncharacterized protein n=1 Tax=Phycomyces blakesleeanus (strain ATCC 8743b / DSM 1359 / FGSC 10004 / NBRC 33097 / NRRL 1555) TaxID=763407 RepID=A0A163E1A8_PHYB8|nr:hypothetical protein PHYBLDRAFT_144046 [Phycomyces blakesleeanus NRRL 1555(-)]OAD74670.1 hypothetical protein PHYBLDRAFT_144046 [Phycomyces blakesleeanus NRRL 1555(-)]|eukprot:XP_018292710.1 hypothetical protein PHYBLDRAFT_144046 [Phycomyces blakesleeanus NRRL 1555(-)]
MFGFMAVFDAIFTNLFDSLHVHPVRCFVNCPFERLLVYVANSLDIGNLVRNIGSTHQIMAYTINNRLLLRGHTANPVASYPLDHSCYRAVDCVSVSIMLARHAPKWNAQSARDLLLGNSLKRSDTSDLLVLLVDVTTHAIWGAHWNFL